MKYQKILAGMMVATVMMMTGCSTYNPVQLRQHQLERNYIYYLLDPPLYEGDVVQYKCKDGSQDTVTIQKVTPQSLITSTDQVIPLADLTSLEKKDISKGKTAAAVGAGVGVTAVAIAAIFAATLSAGLAAMIVNS
ncbi:hypothetical protein AH448_10890 [Salmonella enterica subsp. diarizonae]|uniref:hypothetical protein n=1 Tax=Salmonella enterica TaxID=28901 RepID=UPI0003BCBC1A|nr:hypothetical protein [Salmonella enterica]EAW1824026.1 hypothetical protein [Salmonella enterica subsp. diarizonae]EBR3855735.1 hypothetical protein [Salmonella enterica subsp. enterica]ECT9716589.1 hypothetical protein [Salmonella enterica subsp. diarizonae str. CFSAN000553]EDT6984034.1 hypothetical protein [Salmonella enterica subsp. arizonae]EGE4751984.1 hypothetical protein [Salmonella enterica subsp. diarizonae serovar 38:[k]:z35]ESJ15490.1 phage-related lipoprotein [Salmonella enteri